MAKPRAQLLDYGGSGRWQVIAKPWRSDPVNVTVFRGAPTEVSSVSTTDPFGPAAASLRFPAVTLLESLDSGDLEWLAPETDVDIVWVSGDRAVWTWEGYFSSYDYDSDGLSVSCSGAMRQLDNYQAKPEYLYQPLPYEEAIRRAFLNKGDLRVSAPNVAGMFPEWWQTVFSPDAYPANRPWLMPSEVRAGQLWSGMVTRETGHWEPALTSYIQGLLSSMHTERGQFTLLLEPNRRPVLRHRDHKSSPDAETLVVDVVHPGVQVSASRDFTQRANTVYAKGKSAAGDAYSGMQVSPDGSRTWYEPAAHSRLVYPPGAAVNDWWDPSVMRREVALDFSDGLTAAEAEVAARRYLRRFADPGVTGTIDLTSDPVLLDGTPVPRQCVHAGSTVLIRGLLGVREGILVHLTETSVDGAGKAVWTFDTSFRDHITVDQVRRRGRDSLVPYRMLSTTGTFDPRIPDLLLPWSYELGSGYLPLGSYSLFQAAPGKLDAAAVRRAGAVDASTIPFPWSEYTRAMPPKDYPGAYIKIGPRNGANADRNWANLKNWVPDLIGNPDFAAFPVRLGAAGKVKLFQFAAYDRDGNVKRVPFHVSLYYDNGISYQAMPVIPADAEEKVTDAANIQVTRGSSDATLANLPAGHALSANDRVRLVLHLGTATLTQEYTVTFVTGSTTASIHSDYGGWFEELSSGSYRVVVYTGWARSIPYTYAVGQHYPFFPNAWEKILEDGREPTNGQQLVASTESGMLAGWGTGYEKAGYWPGASSDSDDTATGMLVDEAGFGFTFTNKAGRVSVYNTAEENAKIPDAVNAFAMVYCDADAAADTYFMGRLYREEYT